MNRRTLVEIAEQLGVSTATVSRALNAAPGVSDKRREQILATASALGYFPNANARRLQGQHSHTLCYAVDVSSRVANDLFFFKDFIIVLTDRCARRGFDLLLHPLTHELDTLNTIEQVLRSGRADGVILSDALVDDERIRRLHTLGLPFVVFGRCANVPDHAWVDVDGCTGIRQATEHLLACGHRRIGLLGLPAVYSCANERASGYFQALARVGIEPATAWIETNIQTGQQAREAMLRLLALAEPPTAFVATSDMLALQAMAAATQLNLRAGHEYAITGFDDLPLVEHVAVPLTTLRQPLERIADALISLLLAVLDATATEHQVMIAPELVVRESSSYSGV